MPTTVAVPVRRSIDRISLSCGRESYHVSTEARMVAGPAITGALTAIADDGKPVNGVTETLPVAVSTRHRRPSSDT